MNNGDHHDGATELEKDLDERSIQDKLLGAERGQAGPPGASRRSRPFISWVSRAVSLLWLLSIIVPFICFSMLLLAAPVTNVSIITFLPPHVPADRSVGDPNTLQSDPLPVTPTAYTAKLGLMGYCAPSGCGWGIDPELLKTGGYPRRAYERAMVIYGVGILGATLLLLIAIGKVRRRLPHQAHFCVTTFWLAIWSVVSTYHTPSDSRLLSVIQGTSLTSSALAIFLTGYSFALAGQQLFDFAVWIKEREARALQDARRQ